MTDRTTTPDPATGQRTGDRSTFGASGTSGSSTPSSTGSYASTPGTYGTSSQDPLDASERERARRAAEDIKHAAKDAAVSTAGAVKNRLSGEFDYRKYKGRQRLTRVANVLRETGASLNGEDEVMARYTERAAERIDHFAQYLDQKDVNEILADARRLARQRPEVFVGSLFVVGLMLGRFLRSSKPDHPEYEGGYGATTHRDDFSTRQDRDWTASAGWRSPSTPSGGLVP